MLEAHKIIRNLVVNLIVKFLSRDVNLLLFMFHRTFYTKIQAESAWEQ